MSEIVEVTCATKGCGYSPFPMAAAFDERCRKTGERFYCPAGHSLVYNGGKSKDEIRIDRLTEQLNRANQRIAQLQRLQHRCHWVGCMFQGQSREGLWTHMRAIHGMPTLAEVQETETREAS